MKVLVAARTPQTEMKLDPEFPDDFQEELVYVPLPCQAASAGAWCTCRGCFRNAKPYGEEHYVARVKEVPDLDVQGYESRIVRAVMNPSLTSVQATPYIAALLHVAEELPEGTLVQRFGSGVRVFHDAPVDDGSYRRWRGEAPAAPLRAFDVLGRLPGALSTALEHDWLDPETRLPALRVAPKPEPRASTRGRRR